MMNYAQGGLHRTAHYLREKGRNGDTELVHMTKGEIKGLQALALAHGGSLTINPDTGLPEANFLKRALPTIAGVAVGAMTMNPMLGSAVAGGLTMATGGSLIQGLMAGVGAYGGAGMVSGLAEAGATQIAAESASQATQQAAVSSGLTQMGGGSQLIAAPEGNLFLPGGSAENLVNLSPVTGAAPAGLPTAGLNVMPQMPILSSPAQAAEALKSGALSADQYAEWTKNFTQNTPAATGADTMTMANLKRGVGIGPQGFSPTNLATNVYDLVKKDPTQTAMAAAPLLTNMDTEERGAPGPSDSGYVSSISPNFRAYVPPQPNPYYKEQYPDYRERRFDVGGQVDDELGGDYSAMGMNQGNMQKGLFGMGYAPGGVTKLPRSSGSDPGIYRDPDPSTRGLSALEAEIAQRKKLMGRFGIPMAEMPKTGIKSLGGNFSDVAAAGGTTSLGGYSDGGRMLKGPGDGMSDSIPASIANKQPARLADGEFVVPADVVSHLGNGSTDAGARKLYSMMDKIRKARTGKKKQAPAVKTNKYLPA